MHGPYPSSCYIPCHVQQLLEAVQVCSPNSSAISKLMQCLAFSATCILGGWNHICIANIGARRAHVNTDHLTFVGLGCSLLDPPADHGKLASVTCPPSANVVCLSRVAYPSDVNRLLTSWDLSIIQATVGGVRVIIIYTFLALPHSDILTALCDLCLNGEAISHQRPAHLEVQIRQITHGTT